MNILFLSNFYPGFGGVERVSDTLIDYLGKCHNIYSLSQKAIEGAIAPARLKEYFVYKSDRLTDRIDEYNGLIESLDIDIVINQGMYPNIYPIVFNEKRNKNVKIVSTLHGMPGYAKAEYVQFRGARKESTYKKKIRNVLIRLGIHGGCNRYCKLHSDSYRTAAVSGERIILLSPFYIASFIDKYSLRKYSSKISAIPNPLPCLPGAVSQWKDKENVILFVGRLALEKRVDIILDLWNRLSENPALKNIIGSWRLVIVGDGPCRKDLENIAQTLNLENCTFAGNTTEVQKYYSKAKMLLLTSKFEGLPMCLIEAQKFGCVPVAFDISLGVRDILDNGSGMIAKQDDIDELESRVAELILDDEKLQGLSEKSISNSERFSIDNVGQMWDKLIESL